MFNGVPFPTEQEISFLVKTIKDNDLSEINIEYKDTRIVVKAKTDTRVITESAVPTYANIPANTIVSTAPVAVNSNDKIVKSPIVGTFYSAPSPDKPPFAPVGQKVKKGDVLMLIESMKIMNEVTSDYDGVVKEILIKNAEAVEFDQPIMIIG
ncbi:hypothetical protein FACS1894132_08710 [Clostridia bacterium]|nr:hypothetical protein FACS1894132_08710 [Clostridia bacterium]